MLSLQVDPEQPRPNEDGAAQTFASLRELERWLHPKGRVYPIAYQADADGAAPDADGLAGFDDCFLFHWNRNRFPLPEQPQHGLYASMADCIAAALEPAASDIFHEHFARMRTSAYANWRADAGGMVSSMGSFAMRLPIWDIIQTLTPRFCLELIGHVARPPASTLSPRDDLLHFLQRATAERTLPPVFGVLARSAADSNWRAISLLQDAYAQAPGDPADELRQRGDALASSLTQWLAAYLNGPDLDPILARSGKLAAASEAIAYFASLLDDARQQVGALSDADAAAHDWRRERFDIEWDAYVAIVASAQSELMAWRHMLEDGARVFGDAPNLYESLQRTYKQATIRLEGLRAIAVRDYILDDALQEALYQRHMTGAVAEALQRLVWETRHDDQQIRLGLTLAAETEVAWRAEPDQVEAAQQALLAMAATYAQPLWEEHVMTYLESRSSAPDLAEQLWGRADPLIRYQATNAQDRRHTAFLSLNGAGAYRRNVERALSHLLPQARQLQDLASTDAYACTLISAVDHLPLSAAHAYQTGRDAYLLEPQRGYAHAFAAEQHAVAYEMRLEDIHERPRLFVPSVTALLEHDEAARLFALCLAYGMVALDPSTFPPRLRLALSDGGGLDLGSASDDAPVRAALSAFLHALAQGQLERPALQDELDRQRQCEPETRLAMLQAQLQADAGVVSQLKAYASQDERDMGAFVHLVIQDELNRLRRGRYQ